MTELSFSGTGYRRFDHQQCDDVGNRYAAAYQSAAPYPHIVIDDFLDKDMLRNVADHYPATDGRTYFDRSQERFKFQFGPDAISHPDTLNLLAELNSLAFISFLEKMTGITGLIPDPHFSGGGLHLTRSGGHLGVHADFNIHRELKLERRLNLLVYLNDDWGPEFGGELELWDTKMTKCEVSVAPVLGRAVVFSTTLDSYHGQPNPLACPPDRDRRSIATYYYTAFTEGLDAVPQRTTNFRSRPGTTDKKDRQVALSHLINDWVPLRLQRYARKLNRFR